MMTGYCGILPQAGHRNNLANLNVLVGFELAPFVDFICSSPFFDLILCRKEIIQVYAIILRVIHIAADMSQPIDYDKVDCLAICAHARYSFSQAQQVIAATHNCCRSQFFHRHSLKQIQDIYEFFFVKHYFYNFICV